MKLSDRQAIYILWNAILNQSQDAKRTIDNTLTLMDRLNIIDEFNISFSNLNFEKIYDAMTTKPILHRFYNKMSNDLMFSVDHIMNDFCHSPSNVFLSSMESRKIIDNLLSFRGIGDHKAQIAYMMVHLYIEISNNKIVKIDQSNFSICPSLYQTLDLEIEILDSLI